MAWWSISAIKDYLLWGDFCVVFLFFPQPVCQMLILTICRRVFLGVDGNVYQRMDHVQFTRQR